MPRLALVAPLLFLCGLCSASSPCERSGCRGESPAHISVVDGAALLERDGRSESAPASMPLLAGDRVRTQNGRVEILFDDGSTLHLDTNTRRGLPVRRSHPAARRARAPQYPRRRRRSSTSPTASTRRRHGSQIVRTGEYRISVYGGAERRARAEVELAVLRGARGSRQRGRPHDRSAPASAPSLAPERRLRLQYVFNSASWDAFDRWSEARRDSPARRVGGVPARERPDLRVDIQPVRVLAERADLRLRLVSARARRVAALLLRQLDDAAALGLDVDWIGPVGVADAPLRAMGFLGRRVVLDSRPHLGSGVGVVGLRARLRQLVSARVEQPRGVRVQRRHGYGGYRYNRWNAWTVVPHGGFGRGYVNVNVVNSHAHRRSHAQRVCRARRGSRRPRIRRASLQRADSFGRCPAAPSSGKRGQCRGLRGSRTRSAPGTAATADGDPAAAFRSRRSSSAPLKRQRLSGAGAAPRDMSSLPAPTRQGTVSARPPTRSARRRVRPRVRAAATARACRAAWFSGRRAVDACLTNSAAPSRRAPEHRSTPDTYSSRHQQPARGLSGRAAQRTSGDERQRHLRANALVWQRSPRRQLPDRSYRVPSSPERTQSGCSGSQPRDATVGTGRRRIAVRRLSRPRAFPTHRRFCLEARPRAQRAGDRRAHRRRRHHPSRPAVVRLRTVVRWLRAGTTVGGIGWR